VDVRPEDSAPEDSAPAGPVVLGDFERLVAIDFRSRAIAESLERHDVRLDGHMRLAATRHEQTMGACRTLADGQAQLREDFAALARHVEQSGTAHRSRIDSVTTEIAEVKQAQGGLAHLGAFAARHKTATSAAAFVVVVALQLLHFLK